MAAAPQCEVCKGTHRVVRWNTPAGGRMLLCVVCHFALSAVAQWQTTMPAVSLDALIAELPAYRPDLETGKLGPRKKIA